MKNILFLLLCGFLALTQNTFAQCDTTDAGTFEQQDIEVCGNEDAVFTPVTDFVLDDDDALVYIVHENETPVFSEIKAIFPNSVISYSFTMQYGQTYYVSAMAGNAITTDDQTTVDWSDPCLSFSAPSTVTFLNVLEGLNFFQTPITCFQDGQLFYQGNTDNFTFLWDTEFNTDLPWISVWESDIYSVTITNNTNGCSTVEEHFIFGSAFGPEINNVFWGGNVTCGPDYTYHVGFTFWNTPGPYTYDWELPNGTSFTSESNEVIAYESGDYCVTVTDADGCQNNHCHFFTIPEINCASVEGKLRQDANEDCISDAEESNFRERMVRIFNEDFEYFTLTDTMGDFSKDVLPGTYQVEAVADDYWGSCSPQEVTLANEDASVYVDLAAEPLVECVALSVDLASGLFRSCMESTYALHYSNIGTLAAENAYIDLTLDNRIEILSANFPYTNPEPEVYRFDLGTVEVTASGSILIQVDVECGLSLGETICSTAEIFPNEPCEVNANWNGASIVVNGECVEGEVRFTIENAGLGNMDMPSEYIVIEDGVILMTEPVEFELDAGQTVPSISYAANGSTYILQAMQVPNHPGFSMPTVAIEGCGTDTDGTFSTGFITQFYLDENDDYISEDCRIITGSYDPNDKQGFPRGYGENHFIEKGQDLEYLIRFQNTGTDTAFVVRIDDVLAPELDITTLRPGASSHPYELNIRGADTLEFLFENILLPDSFVNEVASQGFVQFKISQKPDLELGTIIENTAGIYFDFNEAVITNTTFHELGEMFVEVTDVQEAFQENLRAKILPNPTADRFTLSLSGVDFQKGRLEIFDVTGRLVSSEIFTNQNETFRKDNKAEGVYFYKIYLDNEFAASGKIIFTL